MLLKFGKMYSQRDPLWKDILLGYNTNKIYTIGNYGCLITCLATYLSSTGKAITPKTLNEKLKASGGFVSGTGLLLWESIGWVFPEYKLEIFSKRYDGIPFPNTELEKVKELIKKGYFVILEIDFNPLNTGEQMHFVGCGGIDDTGEILIYDPWIGSPRKLSEYGDPKDSVFAYKAYSQLLEIYQEEIVPIVPAEVYPEWKMVLWRAFRVFISGCLATLTVDVIIRLTNAQTLEDFKAIIVITLTGGIAALGKWIRDTYGNKDLSLGFINKLFI